MAGALLFHFEAPFPVYACYSLATSPGGTQMGEAHREFQHPVTDGFGRFGRLGADGCSHGYIHIFLRLHRRSSCSTLGKIFWFFLRWGLA